MTWQLEVWTTEVQDEQNGLMEIDVDMRDAVGPQQQQQRRGVEVEGYGSGVSLEQLDVGWQEAGCGSWGDRLSVRLRRVYSRWLCR